MATIKIEVTYDPASESLSQALAGILSAEHTSATAPVQSVTPALITLPNAQNAAQEPSSAIETLSSKKADETGETVIAKADARALAVALSKSNKPALKSIFKDLGVTSFSGVNEKDYAVFYEKLIAAGAKVADNG